ncbi:MAG: DUF5060 domain-containing protein [Kiritimatiellae bacterium]|nr:DUF5060 domain-containing protein [Kiritimatiellia bacterium]
MKNEFKKYSGSLIALAAFFVIAPQPAMAAPVWVAAGNKHTLTFESGEMTWHAHGLLEVRANGQPKLSVSLFQWHDAWVYDTLESGSVEACSVLPDTALQVRGLWGTSGGAAPLRYTLKLTPQENQVAMVLDVEKTAPLKLCNGVWATIRTAIEPDEGRTVFLFPNGDATVGKSIEGVFKQAFIGQESGAAVCFSGQGLCSLRSRMGGDTHTFEVKFTKKNDFALNEKMRVVMSFGFATMPEILRPTVACAAPLTISARAPKQVALYGKCEIDVALSGTWDNPYDSDDIALDAEVVTASGRRYKQPGFFMVPHLLGELMEHEDVMLPNGDGQWKVRLAATEIGPMRVTLTARDRKGNTVFQLPQPILVTSDKQAKGFVRVSSADAHYLAHDSGEGYVPVGHNVPIYQSSNGMSVKDILEKMAAHGENWNRWWMSRSGLGIEWEKKLGWYRQPEAAKLDLLLEDAGRLGMYYQLCMDTHQDFRGEGWEVNPFNAVNGGPCKRVSEWFTDAAAKAFYRKRLRYTVARWGYSPHVLCWEFGNEFEGWADVPQETIIAWHREMAPVLAALDPYNHLISTSWWSKTGPEDCWRIPEIDFVQTHSYANNELNVALETRDYCLTQWNGFQKPHLFVEFGIRSHNFSPEADPTGRALHNTMWAAVASGCCGAPMPWWHENYIEPKELYFHFRSIRNFLNGLPFGTAAWRQVAVTLPEPIKQPARASQRDAVALTRSEFRKPAAAVFRISDQGGVSDAGELLALLHGGAHRDLINPPTFEVTYPVDGSFVIHVNKVSNSGLLKVFVDDTLALEQPLPCGENCGKSWQYVERWKLWESVYDTDIKVPVKAGAHRIRVENHGRDWVEISRYTFTGCRTQELQAVHCYALAAPDVAVVWFQNDDSTWVNHAQHATEIRPYPAADFTLDGFADGEYEVEWWETWKGAMRGRAMIQAAGGKLTLRPGPIATDTAAKIRAMAR